MSKNSSAHERSAARSGWLTALDWEALCLACQLTPTRRHLLVRAGLPRWMRLAIPWRPASGREAAAACALAARPFGILEVVPGERGAYQLTHLGKRVAGIALLNILTLS